jgi:hypothetical protein
MGLQRLHGPVIHFTIQPITTIPTPQIYVLSGGAQVLPTRASRSPEVEPLIKNSPVPVSVDFRLPYLRLHFVACATCNTSLHLPSPPHPLDTTFETYGPRDPTSPDTPSIFRLCTSHDVYANLEPHAANSVIHPPS